MYDFIFIRIYGSESFYDGIAEVLIHLNNVLVLKNRKIEIDAYNLIHFRVIKSTSI